MNRRAVALAITEVPADMDISKARQFVGKHCAITLRGESGEDVVRNLCIRDVQFVPLYGVYLIGDVEDVCLDRVADIAALEL